MRYRIFIYPPMLLDGIKFYLPGDLWRTTKCYFWVELSQLLPYMTFHLKLFFIFVWRCCKQVLYFLLNYLKKRKNIFLRGWRREEGGREEGRMGGWRMEEGARRQLKGIGELKHHWEVKVVEKLKSLVILFPNQ
jgi:hypothetical protein